MQRRGDNSPRTTIAGDGDADSSYPRSRRRRASRWLVRRSIRSIRLNQNVVRFGLFKMRQGAQPQLRHASELRPGRNADASQLVGDWTPAMAPVEDLAADRFVGKRQFGHDRLLTAADAANANTTILTTLAKDTRTAGGLLPAGNDDSTTVRHACEADAG